MCILSSMCSGQLFLVGHMSLNLSYAIRGSSHATTLYPWSFTRALRQLFASAHALLTGAQDDISIITLHSSAFGVNPSLSWYLLLLINPSHCLPSILTPTELVPGACFACSATQPTHALTLCPSEQQQTFSCTLLLLSAATHSKRGCESLADTLKHQQGSCVLLLYIF